MPNGLCITKQSKSWSSLNITGLSLISQTAIVIGWNTKIISLGLLCWLLAMVGQNLLHTNLNTWHMCFLVCLSRDTYAKSRPLSRPTPHTLIAWIGWEFNAVPATGSISFKDPWIEPNIEQNIQPSIQSNIEPNIERNI